MIACGGLCSASLPPCWTIPFRFAPLCLAVCVAASALPLRADAQGRWRTVADLPTTIVTAALQDRDGFVWVGTHAGLARTDGHTVEVFRPDDRAPGSLPSLIINIGALLESTDGTLWVGTREGLCRRRPTSTRFDCLGAGPAPALENADVTALAEGPDGTLWAGTAAGLYAVDPATLQARRQDRPGDLPSPYVSALAVASDGTVWAGTARGLAVRAPRARSFRPAAGAPPNTMVYALLAPPSGEVWAGTLGRGLYHTPGEGTPLAPVPLAPAARTADPRSRADSASPRSGPDQIVALHLDPSGTLWVGTWGGGLLRYDPAMRTAEAFRARPGVDGALPSDQVVALDIDARGGVWAATWGGLTYRPPSPPYRLLAHDPDDPASLSHPHVTSVLPDPSGDLWVGTFGGGLNRCDPTSLRCRRYAPVPGDPTSLCHDVVLDLAFDADGGLWVATSGAGVCRLDPATGTFAPALPDVPPEVRTAHVYALSLGRTGEAWLGTAEDGLAHVLPRPTGRPAGAGAVTFSPPLADTPVYVLARAPDATLWAGTLGQGLCRVSASGAVGCLRAATHGLFDDWVTTLAPAPGGLWVGGPRGLDWVPRGGRPQHVLREDDLPRPHVTCVLPTAAGTWAATASGVLFLDPRSRKGTSLAPLGLPTRGYRTACALLPDGRLAFGTDDGLLLLDPDARAGDRLGPTRLTAVQVDGRDAWPGVPAHRLRTLTLQPDQGGPSFHFATLSHTAPDARLYRVRLDGFDTGWSRPTDRAEASYPKLPPGRYTFRVRPALQPLAAEAAVRLVVLAPVWRRPWFVALAGLLLVLALATAYRARVRSILRAETLRRQIADDLHDHVGSRLSALALSLDVAAQTLPETVRHEVGDRADQTRSLLHDLRDTVWVVDGVSGSLSDLVERVRSTAEMLLPTAAVDLETRGPLDVPLSMVERRHLLAFAKEAFHNAARHGRPSRVTVTVESRPDGTVRLDVADDGAGFTLQEVPATGHGLRSLHRRADALGGTLDLDSAPQSGTRVAVVFRPASQRGWRDRVRR